MAVLATLEEYELGEVVGKIDWPTMDPEGNIVPASYCRKRKDHPVMEWQKQQVIPVPERTKTNISYMAHNNNQIEQDSLEVMEQDLPGGKHYIQHSDRERCVVVEAEDGDTLKFWIKNNTRVYQVRDMLGSFLGMSELKMKSLAFRTKIGKYWKEQFFNDEIANWVKVGGIKTFTRPRTEYKHPVFILGCGFGGVVTAMKMLERGRTDFIMMDRLHDFGGWSWYGIPNWTTKLQTEAGSYHLEFFFRDLPWDETMPTWPSCQYLRLMFHRGCRRFGLEEYAMLNRRVTKVQPKGERIGDDRWYSVYHEPADGSGEPEILPTCCCMTWPGNLYTHKVDEYPGEELFGGYIEYASLNRPDFTQCAGKETIIVGHGAFAIENCRTVLEFDCAKMTVVCRRRNITAPKPVSWIVTQSPFPIPGPVMMDMLCDMYKLVNWDPWTCYAVTTDAKHSFCRIDQGTMFGVTDVYFVAGYFGLMTCVIGDVKKLTYQTMHLKTGKKVSAQVLLKTVGVRGNYEVDRMMGLKELLGYYVNGDPMRPCITNSLFVQASNFAGFSIGPGLAGSCEQILWFVDYPDDFEIVRGMLPRHNKELNTIYGNALYVYSATHATTTAMALGQCPGLNAAADAAGGMKSYKQRIVHPPEKFLGECMAEWQMYIDMCRSNPNCRQDVEDPPYPYPPEVCYKVMERAEKWMIYGIKE